MQSQMIGMQSSLDRILMLLSQNQAGMHPPSMASAPMMRNNGEGYNQANPTEGQRPRQFPPLPGFAPPVSADTPLEPLMDPNNLTAAQIRNVWHRSEYGSIVRRRVRGYSTTVNSERAN